MATLPYVPTPQNAPSPSPPLSVVYCNDEHIATRAPNDYLLLCPHWQQYAVGSDGFIAGATPWVLSSRSTSFDRAGVKPGNVVLLTAPTTRFQGGGELYAVDAVSHHSLTLRQLGAPQSGVGLPPGTGINMVGVEYTIRTLDPQIEETSFDLNRKYLIDPNLMSRDPAHLYDLRELRNACALQVITMMFLANVNQATGSSALVKLEAYQRELQEVQARLHLRWKPTVYGDAPTSNPFTTRLVR